MDLREQQRMRVVEGEQLGQICEEVVFQHLDRIIENGEFL